jgi:hypothetical protein
VAVDPFSIDALAEGIERVAGMKRFDAEGAKRWARSFSWERAALEHLGVYRNVAGQT